MFGDLMGIMGKLKETQEKVAATKQRLNSVLIDEESNDGLLKVTITANTSAAFSPLLVNSIALAPPW